MSSEAFDVDATGAVALRVSSRLQLIRLPRAVAERWPLDDRYVELVWVEVLGVTAMALARRLELLMSGTPPADATSLDALATPLHVPPTRVVRALRRLHHHGLLVWREHVGVIGLSGYARPVPRSLFAELSPYGARLHEALSVDSGGQEQTGHSAGVGDQVRRGECCVGGPWPER